MNTFDTNTFSGMDRSSSCTYYLCNSVHRCIYKITNKKSLADRKKDLVKLQAGEYVSLGKVEAELKTCPLVENICVYGDPSKSHTVALVVAHPARLAELAQRAGLPDMDFERLCESRAVEQAVVKELADHARKCASLLGRDRFVLRPFCSNVFN